MARATTLTRHRYTEKFAFTQIGGSSYLAGVWAVEELANPNCNSQIFRLASTDQ